MRIFLTIFLLLFSTAKAFDIPKPILTNFSQSFLIGKARLNFIGFKVYDIALWSENSNFSYANKFAVHISYNMNFSKEDLSERSLEEIENLHQLTKKEREDYLRQLNQIFVNIKKGDEKIALFNPQKGVTIFHNNKEVGKISDLKFARLFIDIWLDENGSYPKVTRMLLAKN